MEMIASVSHRTDSRKGTPIRYAVLEGTAPRYLERGRRPKMSHLEWVLVGFAIIAFAAVAVVVGVLLTRDRGADSHNEPGENQRAGFRHQRGSVPGSSSKDKNR